MPQHYDDAQPPPPLKEDSNIDVCMAKEWTNKSCGQTVFDNVSTFSAFAFPRGARHFPVHYPVRALNKELGVSHARLPVSHTHSAQHPWQPGLWFFYLRGCSDFLWDMGRTLLVRNRCHLAVILEQRAHRVSWATAVMRVAKFILLTANVSAWAPDFCRALECNDTGPGIGVHSMILGPIRAIAGSTSPKPNVGELRSASEIATALNRCARGNFSDFANTNASYLEQALVGFNTLDYTNAAMLARELHDASTGEYGPLDTIQIANQCSADSHPSALADGLCKQPVELWDVRTIVNRWSMRSTELNSDIPRPWSLPNGSSCQLSDSWPMCMSCTDTMSEASCRYKCSKAFHGNPTKIAPQDASKLTYGVPIRNDYQILMERQGALGKSNVWRGVWEKLVTSRLPTLPPPHGHPILHGGR